MADLLCNRDQVLEVAAGPHDRRLAPVSVTCLEDLVAGPCAVEELDPSGQPRGLLPAQATTDALTWILPELRAGEVRRYRLVESGCDLGPGAVADLNRCQCQFLLRGELFTSYQFGPELARPCCWPVLGPRGVGVTNYGPADHPHHRSLYAAHGAVNGQDNWSELEGHARTVSQEVTVLSEGPVFAEIAARSAWETARGDALLAERLGLRVYNLPGTSRLLEWRLRLSAEFGGVFFQDTKEAGLLSVRVAESMEGSRGGRIVNAYGAVGESECWGQPAPWVDYSGPVDGGIVGIALLDHPTNFRYPTPWHVRDYGLFTANCWGLHDFAGDWSVRGDYALPLGESLTWVFRLLVHEGDEVAGDVANHWLNFAHPPVVTVV